MVLYEEHVTPDIRPHDTPENGVPRGHVLGLQALEQEAPIKDHELQKPSLRLSIRRPGTHSTPSAAATLAAAARPSSLRGYVLISSRIEREISSSPLPWDSSALHRDGMAQMRPLSVCRHIN